MPASEGMRVDHKPSSVVDDHLSRAPVARRLERPTREVGGPRHPSPIWSCCGWGLPSKLVTKLLVRSCRTVSSFPAVLTAGGLFSVALSLRLPPLDVIQHPALCSSDFPPRRVRRQTASARRPSCPLACIKQCSRRRAVIQDQRSPTLARVPASTQRMRQQRHAHRHAVGGLLKINGTRIFVDHRRQLVLARQWMQNHAGGWQRVQHRPIHL